VVGSTVTIVAEELTTEQLPLWTTALNCVLWVSVPEVYVVAVFAMSFQTLNGETELCHLITEPVWPDKVRTPLVLPVQTAEPPATEPPTVIGLTVTVVEAELATAQVPL
jgi:hypothetical protein